MPTPPASSPGPARGVGAVWLVLNAGSSSLKAAVFAADRNRSENEREGDASSSSPERRFTAKVERIGSPEAQLTVRDLDATPADDGGNKPAEKQSEEKLALAAPDHRAAATALVDWLEKKCGPGAIAAVAHRIVHGGPDHFAPARLTSELVRDLRALSPFDPDHMPAELDLVEALAQRLPAVPQIACFDTAFHRNLPRVARLLPLPRRFEAQGIRRYGFHGLSYAFLVEELARIAGPAAARGRVILAHLGGGASLAAVHEGQSIDTSMSFTPVAGVPMGTRTGDLDPGLFWYLVRHEKMSPAAINRLINHESGLLGLSETSGDVRDLLAREATDPRAADALAVFCYEVRKRIGSYAAALGGLDTLVFAGGIGENAPELRARICRDLGFLGIELADTSNAHSDAVISAPTARVTVRVIRTDEELMMARELQRVLHAS